MELLNFQIYDFGGGCASTGHTISVLIPWATPWTFRCKLPQMGASVMATDNDEYQRRIYDHSNQKEVLFNFNWCLVLLLTYTWSSIQENSIACHLRCWKLHMNTNHSFSYLHLVVLGLNQILWYQRFYRERPWHPLIKIGLMIKNHGSRNRSLTCARIMNF